MKFSGWIVFTICLLASTGAFAKDEIRDSLVKLHVTQRSPDVLHPWKKESPDKASGSGVIIEGNRILTNAHVVMHASQVFVQANGATEKVSANVAFVAPDVDLAVVTVDDKTFFDNRKPLPINDAIPEIKDTVNVYGYPEGGEQLSITEGIISRIEYRHLRYNGQGLIIQVDAALNPGNSGGPAVVDGKIVGLVFSKVSKADNIGYLIAAEEITSFLKDISDGKYDGKPSLHSVDLQTTENEALRAKLGLKRSDGGLMVRSVVEGETNCLLKPWDVITHVGEHRIDRQGDVQVRDDLRLRYSYYIPKLAVDGKVPMKILREGKPMDLTVDVSRTEDLLVPYIGNGYPRYFIFGPIVFTTMTQELAATLAPLDAQLRYYRNPVLSRQYDRQAFPGEEMVVLGVRLFPDRFSKGYDPARFALVEKINDVAVKNLAQVVTLIREAKGEYLIVSLCGRYETLVFNRQELLDGTEDILVDEGIRNQYSKDLEKAWEGKD